MSRLSIWCGTLLLARSVTQCGCHSGFTSIISEAFPNLIGYTYPNWCGPHLVNDASERPTR